MRKYIIFLVVLLIPVFSFAQTKGIGNIQNNKGSETKNVRAIIVGISNYKNIQKLQYAHTDALAFYKYLISPAGGNVDSNNIILLLNEKATAGRIYAALEEMLDYIKEGDQVIFYFSGHGDLETKTVRQNGFLLAYDAPVAAYMTGGTIAINYLQDFLLTYAEKKCKVVLITDACRSGKLAGGIEGAKMTAAALQEQWQNITKILSSQGGELSYEDKKWGNGGGGVFTHYLLRGLKGLADMNNDKQVTTAELLVYLMQNIPRETKFVQNPSVSGDMNCVIAKVDSLTLLALLNEQSTQTEVQNQLAFKGYEDKLLETLDSSVIKEYNLFQLSISKNLLIDSTETQPSAWSIYMRMKENKDAQPIINNVRRTLLAALQDKAQIVINNYLAGQDIPDSIDLNKAYYEMEHAYKMIDENYILYNNIKARYLLLKACLYETDNYKIIAILNEALALQPDAAFGYFLMGSTYIDLNDYEKAKWYYRKTLELTPRWAYAWNNLGVVYDRMGKEDSAMYFYNKAIEYKIDMPEPYNNIGLTYYDKKEYDKAISYYKQALYYKPNYAKAYSNIGWCYYDRKMYQEALEMFNKALEIKPNDKDYKTNVALCYIKLNDTDKAIKILQEVLKKHDNFARAMYNLGYAYETKKVFDKAIYYYRRAAQTDTSYYSAYEKIANIYQYDLEDYQNAEDYYKKYLTYNPNSSSTYVNYGNLYYNQDKYNEAMPYFKKAFTLDTTDAQAYTYYGICLYYTDKPDEAYEYYQKALKVDPNYATAYIEIGRYYRKKERYEEAEAYYLKAFQVDSTAYRALLRIAEMYENDLNNYVKAIEYYKKYILYNDKNSDAFLDLGNCYYYEKMYDEAIESYTRVLALDSNYKGSYLNIANVYYDKKEYEKAEKYYLKSISKDSCYGRAYSYLGDLYYNWEKYTQAINSYLNAIKCDKKYEARYYTIANIYANSLKQYDKAIDYYNLYLNYAPDRYLGYEGLGYVYLRQGKHKKAEQYFLLSMQKEPEEPWVYYNLSCFYSVTKNAAKALEYLELSLKKGFNEFDHISTDPDMDNIRNLEGFKALIEKYSN